VVFWGICEGSVVRVKNGEDVWYSKFGFGVLPHLVLGYDSLSAIEEGIRDCGFKTLSRVPGRVVLDKARLFLADLDQVRVVTEDLLFKSKVVKMDNVERFQRLGKSFRTHPSPELSADEYFVGVRLSVKQDGRLMPRIALNLG
jgi:hypothetical protein